jgi:hypothetical protein
MANSEEMFSHAERCAQLAETCTDKAVAEKLQQLARDYRDFATQALIPHDEFGSAALAADHRQALWLLSKVTRCNCELKEFLANTFCGSQR